MKKFHRERDLMKHVKRFHCKMDLRFHVRRFQSKKDLRKHKRRVICGTCYVVVLERKGAELWEASERSASDALDPEATEEI